MDFKLARFNMVQQQIRPWDVLDPKILNLLETLPREDFVPEPFRALAYSDAMLPIGYNQVTLPPKIVGKMLQSLTLHAKDTVLEIGTGTGYVTAALSLLTKKVVSLEIFPELSKQASLLLEKLNIKNVILEVENGLEGFAGLAPYEVIVLTGSVPTLPKKLYEQMSIPGRLFAVIGQKPVMSAMLIERLSKNQWEETSLFETMIPPLIDIHLPSKTVFRF